MNIHKSQLFWCSPGVQGFDTLPYIQLRFHYPLAKQILIDTFAAWCDQKLDAQPWAATGQMTSHTHRMI